MNERPAPTSLGARRCAEWLKTCKKLGWPASTTAKLCDLWWEYHDENGRLIEVVPSLKE